MLFVMTAVENAVDSAGGHAGVADRLDGAAELAGDEPDRRAPVSFSAHSAASDGGHEQQRDRQQQRAGALAHPHPVGAGEERAQRPAARLVGVDGLARAGDERLQARDDRVAGMAAAGEREVGGGAAVQRAEAQHAGGVGPARAAAARPARPPRSSSSSSRQSPSRSLMKRSTFIVSAVRGSHHHSDAGRCVARADARRARLARDRGAVDLALKARGRRRAADRLRWPRSATAGARARPAGRDDDARLRRPVRDAGRRPHAGQARGRAARRALAAGARSTSPRA